MISFEVLETGSKFSIPEELADCNQKDYIAINRFIYLYQTGKIDESQFQTLAISSFLGINPSDISDSKVLEKVFTNIAYLGQFLVSFFEKVRNEKTKKDELIIKLNFIHNPMPKIKYRGLTWTGPEDGFKNVTFGQYVEGLGLFLDYSQFNEIETLHKLFKVFYTPQFKNLPKYFYDLKEMNIGIIYGFYHLFASTHSYISSSKITYNGVEIDLSVIFENSDPGKTSSLPGLGPKSILFDLAESGVFGDKESTEKTNMYEILFRLYDLKKKEKDLKEKHKSAKK